PRWGRGLGGQVRRRSGRRAGRGPGLLPARGGVPWPAGASDPPPGRRRLQRLLLPHQVTTMRLLAHHAGEQGLAPLLLLLGSGGVSLTVAIGRARLAAARAGLTRVVGRDQALGGGQAPCLDQELAELDRVDGRELDADPAGGAEMGRGG